MSGETKGTALAIGEGGPGSPHADETQLDLVDVLGLPTNATVIQIEQAREAKRRGRPCGSMNRRTQEWAEFLLSQHTSPLIVLAQIATTGVDKLAASLGCTKLEALQEIRLAAKELAPYVHQKMPLAVDVSSRKIYELRIVERAATDDEVIQESEETGLGLVLDVIDRAGATDVEG